MKPHDWQITQGNDYRRYLGEQVSIESKLYTHETHIKVLSPGRMIIFGMWVSYDLKQNK